jgi:hypothetical protein
METNILIEYDKNAERIKGTLQKWGLPVKDLEEYKNTLDLMYETMDRKLQIPEKKFSDIKVMIFENVPMEEVQKMIDITGYAGVWFEKKGGNKWVE